MWPKPFDIFNWSLYTSMIFLAIFATDWLSLYISLLTNAANAAFMWVSCLPELVLLPGCSTAGQVSSTFPAVPLSAFAFGPTTPPQHCTQPLLDCSCAHVPPASPLLLLLPHPC